MTLQYRFWVMTIMMISATGAEAADGDVAAQAATMDKLGEVFVVNAASVSGEARLDLNPVERFDESDTPANYTFGSLVFKGPWGYNKPENAQRSYPLLVSGFWNEGSDHYAAVSQTYPAFVLSYQKDSEADGRFLGQWITNAIAAGYRIDINRVYLTGFSRGGSGSFPLARGMHEVGRHFAAIIRGAGQSQPDLGNEIAQKTALWYHIGLVDGPTRIQVAREALAFNRGYACNREAVESQTSDTLTGYARTTVTLTRSGLPMFRYSEYAGMGHTATPCYADSALFSWLFNCTLASVRLDIPTRPTLQ